MNPKTRGANCRYLRVWDAFHNYMLKILGKNPVYPDLHIGMMFIMTPSYGWFEWDEIHRSSHRELGKLPLGEARCKNPLFHNKSQ